ncbi:unnamed protein product [Brassica oleracea]
MVTICKWLHLQVIVPIENPQDIIVQSAGSMDRELF